MQCPRCGGWHYGMGTPPKVNHRPEERWTPEEARRAIDDAMWYGRSRHQQDPYDRDSHPNGDGNLWHGRVYGVDERDREVTVAFGRDGTTREDHTMIADGHVPDRSFYDLNGEKGHDHIGPGPGKDQFRGKYTGWNDFHDPDEALRKCKE
jgi:hypothetical protein